MDVFKQDALEVLKLVWSLKNSIAPINQIPSEVLSLIPDHWFKDNMDLLSRRWYILHYHRSTLLLPLGERLLLVVVEWEREAK